VRPLQVIGFLLVVAFAVVMIYVFMQNPNGVVPGQPPTPAPASAR